MSIIIILNVLFGLLLAWSLISLASMQVQEWIAGKFKWRSKMLAKSIGKLLTDPILTDQFFNHPLIRSLFTGKNMAEKPSYIPGNQFTRALVDILSDIGTEASLFQQQLYSLFSQTNKLPKKRGNQARERIGLMLGMIRKALVSEAGEDSYTEILDTVKTDLLTLEQENPRLQAPVDALFETIRLQKQQVNDALVKLSLSVKPSSDGSLTKLKAGITALSVTHPQLKQTLNAIIKGMPQAALANGSELDLIHTNIEEWFNNAMNRLTGWYKRRCLITTLAAGIALAMIFNVDSINLTTRLWKEPDLRVAIISNIGEILSQENTSLLDAAQLTSIQQQFSEVTLPVGWLGAPLSVTEDLATAAGGSCTLYPRTENDTAGLQIMNQCFPLINAPQTNDALSWLIKLGGILMSGIAASPGASFWFDLLKKVVNVRLSGKKPSEAVNSVISSTVG